MGQEFTLDLGFTYNQYYFVCGSNPYNFFFSERREKKSITILMYVCIFLENLTKHGHNLDEKSIGVLFSVNYKGIYTEITT